MKKVAWFLFLLVQRQTRLKWPGTCSLQRRREDSDGGDAEINWHCIIYILKGSELEKFSTVNMLMCMYSISSQHSWCGQRLQLPIPHSIDIALQINFCTLDLTIHPYDGFFFQLLIIISHLHPACIVIPGEGSRFWPSDDQVRVPWEGYWDKEREPTREIRLCNVPWMVQS